MNTQDMKLVESVVVDNEHERVVRIDKYLPDGSWWGNDIHVTIKQGQDSVIEQAVFG